MNLSPGLEDWQQLGSIVTTLDIIDQTEVLAGLFNLDDIHEISWELGISLDFAIDLDQSLFHIWISLAVKAYFKRFLKKIEIGMDSPCLLGPNNSWGIPSAVSFVGLHSNRMLFSSLHGFHIRSTMFSVCWLTLTCNK